MNRILFVAAVCCAAALLAGSAGGQKADEDPADTLQGVLRVHPKFHYRYYIDTFGDGQSCGLFAADDELKAIKPGSIIKVQGRLASKYCGAAEGKSSALVSTWIIYMDVDRVEVVGR